MLAGERDLIARGPWQTADGLIVARGEGDVDGALGSRGAVLLDDYADRPHWRGSSVCMPEGHCAFGSPAAPTPACG